MFDATKIDFVAISPDETTVRLYIVCDLAWTGSDPELLSFQEKINNYVSFALDGQMVSTYPEAAGLDWQIVIDCQAGRPDDRSALMIDQVATVIRQYGGDLIIQ